MKPGKSYIHHYNDDQGRLHLSQVCAQHSKLFVFRFIFATFLLRRSCKLDYILNIRHSLLQN